MDWRGMQRFSVAANQPRICPKNNVCLGVPATRFRAWPEDFTQSAKPAVLALDISIGCGNSVKILEKIFSRPNWQRGLKLRLYGCRLANFSICRPTVSRPNSS